MNNSLPEVHSTQYVVDKLEEAGFEILEARDHRLDGELPWLVIVIPIFGFNLVFRAGFLGIHFLKGKVAVHCKALECLRWAGM